MDPSDLIVNRRGAVVEIRIHRPRVRNALVLATWQRLHQHIAQLAQDETVRILLIGGDRAAFCAGVDREDLGRAAEDPRYADEVLDAIEAVMCGLEDTRLVTVAVIEGPAIGGGMELATACDLRLMSTTAVCGIPSAKLGIAVAGTDVRRLTELIGRSRTFSLLATGRVLTAAEALAIGWADEVAEPDQMQASVDRLATLFSQQARQSVESAKRWTRRGGLGEEDPLADARVAWRSEEFRQRVANVKGSSR